MTDFQGTDGDLGDEVLSAYLSGELDEAGETAVDERLARDPALAARLDRLAEVVGALRGLDTVEPPPGFRGRLDARLAAEQAPEVASLDRARSRPAADETPGAGTLAEARHPRRSRWPMVGAAAAALVVVALGAAGFLQGLGAFTTDETADAPVARTQDAQRPELFADAAPEAAVPDEAPEDAAGEAVPETAEEAVPAPDAPAAAPEAAPEEAAPERTVPERHVAGEAEEPVTVVVRDDAVELPDPVTIRRRYGDLPEAAAVLGAAGARAERFAAGALASLDAAGVAPGGLPATACWDAVETVVGAPAVVVLVESAVTPQGPALAHVVVGADGGRLERVEALLLDPVGCTPLERVVIGGSAGG